MTDNLRDRIAAVLIKHHTDCDDTVDGTWTQCECDAGWRREDEWAVHVAAAVIAYLGLHEEVDLNCCTDEGETISMYRYVTEWTTDD